ncbi:MAG: serine hydrolase [Propionibacteriales bacterium]|nr:serine hydrolase [Propionibacteriales bacterium]
MTEPAGGLQERTRALLSARVAEEQRTRRVPSVAAAVVRDGQVVWSDAAGHLDGTDASAPATPRTAYRIGSITKTFVATQVLQLRDEGRLDLNDRIGEHLAELELPVTVAQLLSHTSGLQAETNGPWWERTPGDPWDALVASRPRLLFTPGTRFHYSNTGFGVLGELVARLRGTSWHEAVHADLLRPLGMTATRHRPDDAAAPGLAVHPFADLAHVEPEHDAVALAPAGQLWSSAEDLARWAAFAAGHTGGLLAPETLREMHRPVAVVDRPGQPWTGAHALGWQVWNEQGRRFVGHGGSMPGFLASLHVDVDSGDGVVVLANVTSGLGTLDTDLLELVRSHEPRTPTPWVRRPGQRDHLDLVGDWFWGTSRSTARLDGDHLVLGTPGVGRGARFRPDGDGWVGLGGYYENERLTVRRDADGRPVQLDLATFAFTRTPYDSSPDVEVPGGLDEAGWS